MSFTSFLSDRGGQNSSQPQAQTANQLFGSTTFSSTVQPQNTASSSTVFEPDTPAPLPTAADLFNAQQFDPAKLHPLAGLGDSLDYLLLDEDKIQELPGGQSALPSRGWTDELSYGTGTTYLSGLAIGGLYGVQEGMRRNLGNTSSAKLRLNSVLNSVTRRGSFLGNSLGVLALMYNAINSTIDSVRGQHDFAGGLAAAGISGAIFRSTAGLKPAVAGATLMMGASAAWTGLKRSIL